MEKVPDPSPILELIEAFRRSKAMFAAVSLGVFDHLEQQAFTAPELAKTLQVKAEPLERLLNACVSLDLLQMSGPRYRNQPIASMYLCRASKSTLSGYILYSNEVLFPLWSHVEDAVREGTPRWKQTFGIDASIFEHFFRTEEAKQTFIEGMHGFGLLSSPKVVRAFDLSRFKKMVDLGGATGHLAIAACELYSQLRAVVFDLPQVLKVTEPYLQASPCADRISILEGNFFEDELPSADLYALGRILHDWSETKIETILNRIYARLPSGGAILLAEKLLREDKSGPVSGNLQSLNMLMCTEGKERSLSEYRQLLSKAGFERIDGRVTGSTLDAVIGFRP